MTLERPVGVITPEMVEEANKKYQEELAEKRKRAQSLPTPKWADEKEFIQGQRMILSDASPLVSPTTPKRVCIKPELSGIETRVNGWLTDCQIVEYEKFAGMVTAYLNLILEQLPCSAYLSGTSTYTRNELMEVVENITNYTGMFLCALTDGDPEVQHFYNTMVVKGDRQDISLDPEFLKFDDAPRELEDGFKDPLAPEVVEQELVPEEYISIDDGYDQQVDVWKDSRLAWDYYDNPYADTDVPPLGSNHKIWDWYDLENAWNPEINDVMDSDSFICDINCVPYLVNLNGKPVGNMIGNALDYVPASPDDMVLPIKSFAKNLHDGMQDALDDLAINKPAEGLDTSPAMMYMLLTGNPYLGDFVTNECSLYRGHQCVELHAVGNNWNRYRKLLVDTLTSLLGFNVSAPANSMEEAEWIDAAEVVGRHVDNAAYHTYVDFHKTYRDVV